ncbi:hypothetical protein CRG98_036884 [Punica granatum]|uniref:Transmembrane protein 220 n=1 Tax=Punica granatum TaxID=22663 RepID=A0A2I0IHF9_PUNGR|nr:hypothetical protein CRG98_036884 [Punica granatum]
MTAPTKLLRLCSLLMALLFGYSASAQLDDPDWYLWLPLYACACIVNLANPTAPDGSLMRKMAKLALVLGLFLFFKVVVEDGKHGIAGFWSLDMRERVVREKFGSGLVVSSMFLHLQASSPPHPNRRVARFVEYGMGILVGISYGLSFMFFAFHKDEKKF